MTEKKNDPLLRILSVFLIAMVMPYFVQMLAAVTSTTLPADIIAFINLIPIIFILSVIIILIVSFFPSRKQDFYIPEQ